MISKEDLIKRNLAIAYATSGLIRNIDGEDWIRTSEVKQSLNDVPTVEQEVYMTGEDYDQYMRGYNQARKDFAQWITIDDVMSVFDDFMRGDISENDTEEFLEMLKDKIEQRGDDQ